MIFHGKYVYCACGVFFAMVKDLVPQRGRGKCVKLHSRDLFNVYHQIYDGRKIYGCCGKLIGRIEDGIILIPLVALKQTKSSVYIDYNDEIDENM